MPVRKELFLNGATLVTALTVLVAGESQPLVAVGTSQSFGEDYPGTGRVLLFQITRKPGGVIGQEEEWDINMVYSRCA